MLHENKVFEKPKLLHLDLEISSVCNFNCSMCPRPKQNGEMDIGTVYSIIHSFAEQGGETIKPFWRGEPTLYKWLPDILKYSKELGLKTMINTNGSFPLDNVYAIIDYTDWISFSIDTAHGNITQKTFENLAISAMQTEYVEVQSTEYNEQIDNFCKYLEVPYKIDKPTRRSESDKTSDIMYGERQYCKFPEWRMIVAWNGDCTLCCVDWELENLIGNIALGNIEDIFNGPKAEILRKNLKKEYFTTEICANCPSRKAYK